MNLESLSGARVLGINPPVYDFAWFDLWAKPAGLLRLLGYLRERGNDVHLVDCMYDGRTKPLTYGRWQVARTPAEKPTAYSGIPRNYWRFGAAARDFELRLSEVPRPDLVLVTSIMTYWYPGVFEAVETARRMWPGVPVALGGIYAALCPEHAASSGADFVLAHGGGQAQQRPAVLPLDLYENPAYALLSASFGCPMGCGYCASSLLEPRYIRRPIDEVFADVSSQLSLNPLQIRDAAFYDDALLVEPEEVFYPLCDFLRQNYPGVRLHTPNGLHVSMLDGRMCRELRETGFATIRLSLEGIDSYTLAASSSKTGADEFYEAVKNLHEAGYGYDEIDAYILAGLPGQELEDIERSIDFALSLGVRPKLAEYSPIPGTPLFRQACEKIPELSSEPLLHNNTVYAQYISRSISPGDLQRLKHLAAGAMT